MDHECLNCTIMKKKIMLYEKFFEEMKKIEEEEIINRQYLTESIIIEKDNHGIFNKKIKSNLTESFLVIDRGKDLTHLNQKEQNVLNEQTNLHNYNQVKQKIGIVSTVVGYVVSVGKWLAIL